MMADEPPIGSRWFSSAVRLARVTAGGVIGRIAMIVIAALLDFGWVVSSLRNDGPWLILGVVMIFTAVLLLIIFWVVKPLIRIVEKNPASVIMEGSELLQYEQMRNSNSSEVETILPWVYQTDPALPVPQQLAGDAPDTDPVEIRLSEGGAKNG